jgi:hypothetical protein
VARREVIDDPDEDEFQAQVFDLVSLGRVDEVERLKLRIANLDESIRKRLVQLAASTGPLKMVQVMVEIGPLTADLLSDILKETVHNGDIDILSWGGPGSPVFQQFIDNPAYGIAYGTDIYLTHHFVDALKSNSEEIFATWKRALLKWADGANADKCSEFILERDVLHQMQQPLEEARVIGVWNELGQLGVLRNSDVKGALNTVARGTCSIQQTVVLLELAAATGTTEDLMGPLLGSLLDSGSHGRSTKKGAHITRFLLLAGAKGDHMVIGRGRTRHVSRNIGCQRISRWLGMTWYELVAWAQEQRSAMQLDHVQDPYSKIIEAFFSSGERQTRV